MIQIRKSEERGHARHGWLDSHHTFSFASYHDPKHMGFRSLRVINEDRVAPGKGFGAHGHRDMEILTYVLSGRLAHKDNLGHQETLGPNEIQKMSAGTGVMHSEFNASQQEPVHFFQIWIEPAKNGLKSSYEQIAFAPKEKHGKWRFLAKPEGGEGIAQINQDAQVAVAELAKDDRLTYRSDPSRHAWVHVIKGGVTVNGAALHTGDAAAVSDEQELTVVGSDSQPSEVLLFDLA